MRTTTDTVQRTLRKSLRRGAVRSVISALLGLAITLQMAQAHLMVAQRGTLNIVGDGVFMVLSLPVSAFVGIDDDGDGKLSMVEFVAHRAEIAAAVTSKVQLIGTRGTWPLEGLMLSPSPPDDAPQAPAPQLVVMGRFVMDATAERISFKLALFGKAPDEQSQEITITRGKQSQLIVLTPTTRQRDVLPFIRSRDYIR
jgi:hypothetical protein